MRKTIIAFALCLTGAFLNIVICRLSGFFGFPLYLDTILTITITLTCGFFWGALCGIIGNTIYQTIWFWGWEGHLFTLCSIATAAVVFIFMKLFPRELNLTLTENKLPQVLSLHKSSRLSFVIDHIIILILLSFALCLTISILGGTIAGFILIFSSNNTEEAVISSVFSATMFGQNFPVILKEILSRIPMNIIDRLISGFGGYGIALGLRKIYRVYKPAFNC
ncbi:MAG: hypothetical protein FWD47_04595 [Treponema sp.]|nr:hypothetical protein [Treponema sp.]